MKIVHSFGERGEGDAGFLLSNKRGDYFLRGPDHDFSAYQGLFIFDPHNWDYFKVIDSIMLEEDPHTLKNRFYEVELVGNSGKEVYCLTDEGFFVDFESSGICSIDFDCRRIHDFCDRGRAYSVDRDDEFIIVEYSKFQEDSMTGTPEKFYIAIIGGADFEPANNWKQKHYWFDISRGSKGELWVYDGLRIKLSSYTRLVFGCDANKTKAKIKAMNLKKKADDLKDKMAGRIKGEDTAVISADYSANSLTLNPNKLTYGMLAGRPWFYQFWSRDELISSVYYQIMGREEDFRKTIMKYIDLIMDDGRIPNRFPHSDLASADGVGWLWKRALDLVQKYELSDEEAERLLKAVKTSVSRIREKYMKDELIYCGPKETWMDTTGGSGDVREGARIEIQALQLCAYRLGSTLAKRIGEKDEFSAMENSLRKEVKAKFFDGRLADGLCDWTCRPNVFIAYYVYPDLLSRHEWKKVFDWALQNLWLDWGGIATIQKDNPLFCEEYTGMNNKSYHRGDSWYWINNMAAICMKQVSETHYKKYIDAIISASKKEMLFSGLVGHCAEVSSAKELRSEGCLCQAWSAALFCELLGKIRNGFRE